MNPLNNLPPFYIGQKVVYITGNYMPKNSTHIVRKCYKAPCGCYKIEIDQNPDWTFIEPKYDYIEMKCCGNVISVMDYNKIQNGWYSQSFRPLQESPFPSLTYSKVVEKESELISLN